MKKERTGSVKWLRTWFAFLRSWLAFMLALVILAAFWFGCFLLIARFAPAQMHYFAIGAIGAGIIGGLMLIFNEPIVVISLHAERIRCREENPKLWDAVVAATPWYARPQPRIYLIPDQGMNAVSFGWGLPLFSAVGATKGIIRALDEDELAAVMAHEVGHIVNKDILVSMAMTVSVMFMAFTGWLFLRLGPYSSSSRSSSDKKGGAAAAILVIILVGFLLYVFGRILGVVLQMFVSRQREYAADAASARIIGRPGPLASALKKIVRDPGLSSRTANAAIGFLCTADPDPDDLMSTHPSIDNRLAALSALEG
jgi:heat shock protein HtpX